MTHRWIMRLVALFCGALLAFSAPGLEQWYLPWFCLTPLIFLLADARDPWSASIRGFYFGLGYSLVYFLWLLSFRPEFCEGTFVLYPPLVAILFWIAGSTVQAVYMSIFPCIARNLTLTGGWLPRYHHGRWHLPTFIVLPLLWVLIDRLCHTTQLAGCPWSSLHYSQYRQLPLIQCASLIGGVGISAWIVLINANIAAIISFKLKKLPQLSCATARSLALNTLFTVALSASFIVYGCLRLQKPVVPKQTVLVTALQAAISEKVHKVHVTDVVGKYRELSLKSPAKSICVWPEWSLALSFTRSRKVFDLVVIDPRKNKQAWVVGVFDSDDKHRSYNSVCAMEEGKVLPDIYHKRYLVPVGEYTPDWIRETPLGFIFYGPNKKYEDTSSGEKAVVFNLYGVKVAPLICFENLYPKLCADSVRAGGELLVDSSDNSWFRKSTLSDQIVAFSVFRAVENCRSFVFATAFGPSTIINSHGLILRQAPAEQAATISCEVPVEHEITPFTRWCF